MVTHFFRILLQPFESSRAIEGYKNVKFREQNEISLPPARWLMTFSIDLKLYDTAFNSFKECIKDVQLLANEYFQQVFVRDVTFEPLVNNITNIRKLRGNTSTYCLTMRIMDQLLTGRRVRCGQLSATVEFYLFEVTSEEDIRVIKRTLGKLANTQRWIVHMTEDSIPIITDARNEITSHKINELITSLKSIVGSMVNAMQSLDKSVSRLKILIHVG